MKSIFFYGMVLAGVSALATTVRADTITPSSLSGDVTLTSTTISDLLGSSYSAVYTSAATSTAYHSPLSTDVINQVYTNSSGLYLYLYQVVNTGVVGKNSTAETFTLGVVDGNIRNIGFVTDTPSGFLTSTSGQFITDGYVDTTSYTNGADISFYYSKRDHTGIAAGAYSAVMYVLSTDAPGTINAGVIDSVPASTTVYGPVAVPEPGTCFLALVGVVGMLFFVRKKIRLS
jgi:hypothetical protein